MLCICINDVWATAEGQHAMNRFLASYTETHTAGVGRP